MSASLKTTLTDLPEEMVLKIFELLPQKDIKSVMLVCKEWMEFAENPVLWSWSFVHIDTKLDFQKLKTQRIHSLSEIDVKMCHNFFHTLGKCHWKKCELREMFEAISEIPTIRRIQGCIYYCPNLSHVEPRLFATVFNRLEKMVLWMNHTREQTEHLLAAIAENTNLRSLDVCDVSSTSPALLGSALTNVEEVVLYDDQITRKQMEALLVAIVNKATLTLRKLILFSCPIHNIDPEILGTALSRLEEVRSEHSWVRREQIKAKARGIVDKKSNLKKLMMNQMEPEEVSGLDDEALVKKAKDKIGEFYTELKDQS